MDNVLEKKLHDAVWAAHSLFERGKTSGSSANMSFIHDGSIYITASGSCFGTLTNDDFAVVSFAGESINGKKASKELTLHKYYYEHNDAVKAVIHTHGPYSTLFSCRKFKNNIDIISQKANAVYKIGCNKNHKLNYTCCDFKKLEEHYLEFKNN